MTASGPQPASAHANPGTYGGLFMVTLSTLMYEIALTRIFSVTMWYHFAFVAISIALFGMTVGALIVYLFPSRFADTSLKRHLWLFSLLFAISIACCFVTQLAIPFTPKWNGVGVWSVVLTCVVISVPFIFSGIVVCLSLTRFPDRVNRLYAADLLGAGLGCVLLVLLLNRLDGPSAVIAIGAFAGVGAVLFAFDAASTRGMAAAALAVLALGSFAAVNGALHSEGHPFLRIVWAKETADPLHAYEKWNAFSRITVDGDPNRPQTPYGWGMSTELPAGTRISQLAMVIDGTAGTVLTRYTGDPDETDFLRYDITNLVHYVRPNADVLVVGVGGGRDILSALEFEQNSVTGVEINGTILKTTNDVFGDFTGQLDENPRVKFVNDEARSYLARTDRQYDIIQISLIDTWAATSAGAFALSENSLYTTDAWSTFFSRLKPGGVLSVSRWYETQGRPPLETYRTAALAAQSLKEHGVEDPRQHIVIWRSPKGPFDANVATLLISPDPFTDADLAALEGEAERLKFPPVLTPSQAEPHFAEITAPGGPGAEVDSFDVDISPPTDNRPFFFQMADLESFLNGSAFDDNRQVLQPVMVLGMLALVVLALTVVCIVVPLLLTTDRTAHEGMAPFYGYFAGIGLGFLMVEISQLQRLSVFLGHPTYALTVVLFSVLLSSGIGSALTERFVRVDRPVSLLAPILVLLGVLIVFGFATPNVIERMDSETTPVRIATAVALLFPLGLVMGMPFAIGMRAAASRPSAPVAFFWGINGATSVCASVFATVIALFFGISTAFWVGGAAYAIAAASMAAIVFLPRWSAAQAGSTTVDASIPGEPAA